MEERPERLENQGAEKKESKEKKIVLDKKDKFDKKERNDKSDKNNKVEKIEKVEKPQNNDKNSSFNERMASEKSEKSEKLEKNEKIDKIDKIEKIEKPEKSDKLVKGIKFSDSQFLSRDLRSQRHDTCKEHSDELLNYFCLDCSYSLICSECIIHGTHKNHNVVTVRKAAPSILLKLDEMREKIDNRIKRMEEISSQFPIQKNKEKDKIFKYIKEIRQQTSNAIESLKMKEEKLISSLENYNLEQESEFDERISKYKFLVTQAMQIQESILNLKQSQNFV